jgi:hypothetical protein
MITHPPPCARIDLLSVARLDLLYRIGLLDTSTPPGGART